MAAANLESDSDELHELSIFNQSSQLIKTDKDGKLCFDPTVLKEIEQIDKPLHVVGICGPYRSGKSFLANILSSDQQAFEIGNATTAHTKGIWIKCLQHPGDEEHILIIMDSEGLGDAKKHDAEHDKQVFVLTFLLSSVLIYNTLGVITSDLLDKLELVAKLGDNVQISSDLQKPESEQLFKFVAPKFILCLRDVYLNIEQDYFESVLTPNNTPGSEESDKTRKYIKQLFSDRNCFVFDRPADKPRLQSLTTIQSKDLAQDFKESVKKLRDSVYKSEPKQLAALLKCPPVDGTGFACLLKTFVGYLQRGETINIEVAFKKVAERHNAKIREDIFDIYCREIDTLKIPYKRKKLLHADYEKIKTKAIADYRERSYPYRPDEFEGDLLERMHTIFTERLKKNRDILQDRCLKKVDEMYENMLNDKKDSYKRDIRLFRSDLKTLQAEFLKKAKENEIDQEEVMTALKIFNEKVNKEWNQFDEGSYFADSGHSVDPCYLESEKSSVSFLHLDTKNEKQNRVEFYGGRATEIRKLIDENNALKAEKRLLREKLETSWGCSLM